LARLIKQDKVLKEEFQRRIKEMVQKEKEQKINRIDEQVPSFLSWAVKPLASLALDMKESKNQDRGESGEFNVFLKLKLLLPNEWIIMNDIVIETEPNQFAQNDHIIIGPPGIFVIETKAWSGAYTGYKDYWKRKEGGKWVKCPSPTKQNQRHAAMLSIWLEKMGFSIGLPLKDIIYPIVIFTKAQWLKVSECSMPVYDSGLGLGIHLRRHKEKILTNDQIDHIAAMLAHQKLDQSKKEKEEGKEIGPTCKVCGEAVTEKVMRFSMERFNGEIFCYKHQKGNGRRLYAKRN